MNSSGAKVTLYSLEYVMNTDDITFHSSKRDDNGNQEPRQKMPDMLYYKLTVCMIYHPQNRE